MIPSKLIPSRPFLIVLLCSLINAYSCLRHTSFPPCNDALPQPAEDAFVNPRCAAYTMISEPDWRLYWNRTASEYEVRCNPHTISSVHHTRDFLSTPDILRCARRKNILFIGNSHLRLLVVQLLQMFNVDVTPLIKKRHSSHAFYIAKSETWIVFLWSTFSLKATVSEYIDGFTDDRESHLPRDFDLVVSNRGAWDMLYHETSPNVYYESFVDDIRALQASFTRANVIFMNLHAFHSPNRRELSDPQKTRRIETCFNSERLQVYRSIHDCAIQHVNGWDESDKPQEAKSPIVWLLDMFHLTRAIRPHWTRSDDSGTPSNSSAESHVSNDGHHYTGEINGVFLKMLFRFVCGNEEDTDLEKARMFPGGDLAENCGGYYRTKLQSLVNQTFCHVLRNRFHQSTEFHAFTEKYRNMCSNSTVYNAAESIQVEEHVHQGAVN